jgi:hypothetical protein
MMQVVKNKERKKIAMTICNEVQLELQGISAKKIQIDFHGGEVTSDAGVMLLREADRRLKLTERLSGMLKDERVTKRCDHTLRSMLQQRIYALCLGYEDLNDHDNLRHDIGMQTATGRTESLASKPTLCRFENRSDREAAWIIHEQLLEQFIASHKPARGRPGKPPTEIILDFDTTDDVVHGKQEGRFFHGYYDNYCFLPLYVFCGDQILAAYLRPSNIDPARHAWAILALLTKRLREVWPGARIVFRGDSGFCRWRMMRWCENHGIGYIIGMAKNPRLNELAADYVAEAERRYNKSGEKQRLFADLRYGARTWDHERRVILKAEHLDKGSNPRYVVTNLEDTAQGLYENVYCARGEMENRIKEQQLDLFSDRTSCTKWWPNQFRLLLSSLAYVLIESIRRLGLKGTALAQATCGTIRLKLLKVGAVIVRNTRRIRFHLSSAYPYKEIFLAVARRFSSA